MASIKPKFIDHIVIFVKDVKRTKRFYSRFLGEPEFMDKYQVCYRIGDTKLFFGLSYKKIKNPKFRLEGFGLNHLAFGVRSLKELKGFEGVLNKARIKNSGIKIDKYGKKEFIWFNDPDGIRLEFYLRNKL